VVTQFERAGLTPAGENGYYQSVPLHEIRLAPGRSKVELVHQESVEPLHWLHNLTIRMQEPMPQHIDAPLLFASSSAIPANIDTRGKLLVVVSGHAPRSVPSDSLGVISVDNPHALEPPRWPLQYSVAMRL
jgi:hypothetical protein